MQAIRNGYSRGKDVVSSVIEFRSAASPTYWMIVNSAFWWSVFYLNEKYQLRLLISLAAGIFGWDVLLSSSHEHSPLVHLILWPFREPLRTFGTALTLLSAHYLHKAEHETACWSAYASLFMFLVNPVLKYQRVPQRVCSVASSAYHKVEYFAVVTVVHPVIAVYKVIEYIVLLQWVKVIYVYVTNAVCAVRDRIVGCWNSFVCFNINLWNGFIDGLKSLYSKCVELALSFCYGILNGLVAIRDGIVNGVYRICTGIVNGILAIWNGLINGIKSAFFGMLNAVRTVWEGLRSGTFSIYDAVVYLICYIRDSIVNAFRALWNGFLNGIRSLWFGTIRKTREFWAYTCNAISSCYQRLKLFLWEAMQALKSWAYKLFLRVKEYILSCIRAFKTWMEERVVKPIKNFGLAVGRFLRYWFCAHWWPALKQWLKTTFGVPLERAFNYVCFALVYVFCCYWFRPLTAYLTEKAAIFKEFAKIKLAIFWHYLKQTVLSPLASWSKARLNDLLVLSKRMLHRLAIMLKDSVLWPICLFFIKVLKDIGAYIRATVFQPIFDWFYRKYKLCEDYVLIYALGPVCSLIVNNIPEKSPFCDDSDTELAGFLPEEEEEPETAGEESEVPTDSARSRHSTPLSEDDKDLTHGLIFPSIDASESSDEEFNLKTKPAVRKKRTKRQRQSSGSSLSIPRDASLDGIVSDDDIQQTSNDSERLTPDFEKMEIGSSGFTESEQEIVESASESQEFDSTLKEEIENIVESGKDVPSHRTPTVETDAFPIKHDRRKDSSIEGTENLLEPKRELEPNRQTNVDDEFEVLDVN